MVSTRIFKFICFGATGILLTFSVLNWSSNHAGKTYDDFESLSKDIKEFESECYVNLRKNDSRLLATAKKRDLHLNIKDSLVYVDVQYICKHGGSYRSNKKMGERSQQSTNKIKCPFELKFAATHDVNKYYQPKRMCTHEERRNFVQKMCSKWLEQKQPPLPSHKNVKLFKDDRIQLMYCPVSKAGCTSWKGLWENANSNTTDGLPNTVHVHGGKTAKAGITTISIDNDFENYPHHKKFVIVRNPFDRALSAYNNIVYKYQVQNHIPGPYGDVLVYLKEYIDGGELANLTFLQFLTFLMDENIPDKHRLNDHWISMVHKCKFCYKNYDIISRIETNNYDAGPVLKMMGYPEDILYKNNFSLHRLRSSQDTGILGSKELPEYRNIPDELIDKFIERYKYDLTLFGYSFDRETLTTHCSIELDSGEVCC